MYLSESTENRFGVNQLTADEIDCIGGGIVPLAAVGAVMATTALLGFVDGIFTGIREDEMRKATQ